MWQRLQTVFLSIAAAALIIMILFPVWESTTAGGRVTLYPLYLRVQNGKLLTESYFPYSFIALLAIAGATVSIYSIGKYKDRLLQLKLGAFNSLLLAGCGFLSVYFSLKLQRESQVEGYFGMALYLPFAAMVLNAVANRFIRRDEKVVRDSDRLR